MTPNTNGHAEPDAFTAAAAKAMEVKTSTGAHRVAAKVSQGSDSITITIPISEIRKAKPSQKREKDPKTGRMVPTGETGQVGFMLEDVPFKVGDGKFRLKAGWIGVVYDQQ